MERVPLGDQWAVTQEGGGIGFIVCGKTEYEPLQIGSHSLCARPIWIKVHPEHAGIESAAYQLEGGGLVLTKKDDHTKEGYWFEFYPPGDPNKIDDPVRRKRTIMALDYMRSREGREEGGGDQATEEDSQADEGLGQTEGARNQEISSAPREDESDAVEGQGHEGEVDEQNGAEKDKVAMYLPTDVSPVDIRRAIDVLQRQAVDHYSAGEPGIARILQDLSVGLFQPALTGPDGSPRTSMAKLS